MPTEVLSRRPPLLRRVRRWAFCAIVFYGAALAATPWLPPARRAHIHLAAGTIFVAGVIAGAVRQERLYARLMQAGYLLCPHCGYSLHGLPDQGTCPECGRAFEKPQVERWWKRWTLGSP